MCMQDLIGRESCKVLKVCGIVSKAMSWAYSNSEYRGFLVSQAPEFLKYTDLLQQPSLIKSQILDLDKSE